MFYNDMFLVGLFLIYTTFFFRREDYLKTEVPLLYEPFTFWVSPYPTQMGAGFWLVGVGPKTAHEAVIHWNRIARSSGKGPMFICREDVNLDLSKTMILLGVHRNFKLFLKFVGQTLPVQANWLHIFWFWVNCASVEKCLERVLLEHDTLFFWLTSYTFLWC